MPVLCRRLKSKFSTSGRGSLVHYSPLRFNGSSIHPRLPYDSPNPAATHAFRPRIHARSIRRQTSSRSPLPQALDLVARSDSHVKASLTAAMVVQSLWAELGEVWVTGCWASRCRPRGGVCWPVSRDVVVAVDIWGPLRPYEKTVDRRGELSVGRRSLLGGVESGR
jgi:hypothetical protein